MSMISYVPLSGPDPTASTQLGTKNYVDTHAVPAKVTSGTTVQNFTDAQGIVWVAKNGVNTGTWKRATDALHARWYRSAAFSLTSTAALVTMDTAVNDAYGLYASGNFTCPVAGMYRVWAQVGVAVTANNQWGNAQLFKNATLMASNSSTGGTAPVTPVAGDTFLCAASDTISVQARSSANLSGSTGTTLTFLVVDYLGTG